MTAPALGIIEVSSIARGVLVVDAMAKKAPIQVLHNHPISPGKHLIVVAGGVAEVDEAMQAGLSVAAALVVDRLFLPQAHEQLAPLLAGGRGAAVVESVAIFETYSATATVLAADAAAKAAEVVLLDMRLGHGGLLVGVEIIARPHEDLQQRLMW